MKVMNSAYLDANFLVYYFVSKEPSNKKNAQIIMAKLLKEQHKLYVSPLVLDELWMSVRKELGSLPVFDNKVQESIKNISQDVLDVAFLIDTQAKKRCVWNAFFNTSEYELRPRDAFHLAIKNQNKIDFIVTNDKNFKKYEEKGGRVIWV